MYSVAYRLAIIGTRGIPACYGGFETFADELAHRLPNNKWKITVYCRRKFFEMKQSNELDGISLIYVPTIMHKYLETPLHSLFSFINLLKNPVDVVLLCNAANSPFAWIVRVCGIPLAINVDGIERKRSKWNWIGKAWYRLGELCSTLFASKVIADAKVIAQYYKKTYKILPEVIAYGATAVRVAAGETLAKFGLQARSYILYVSRLEPENNALGVIESYMNARCELPLVIVGDAPYATEYKERIKVAASSCANSKLVIFTGFQFGSAYHELQSNCMIYIQATEVGGTHPALVESMAYGNCIIANGTPENIEVLADAGLVYRKNNFIELSELIDRAQNSVELRRELGISASKRAQDLYSWDTVVNQYDNLLESMVKTK